jgi:hypothetical protein
MSNAWAIIAANQVGAQPIDETSTTQRHTLGIIVQAKSSTYGVGEFIYLQGVGSTVVGSVVNYDALFITALNTTGLSTPRPLAVAMSANVANQFGWYQISGVARVVKSNALSLAVGSCIATSSGAAIVVASGLIVNGAVVAAAASAVASSTAVSVMINRPTDPSDVS